LEKHGYCNKLFSGSINVLIMFIVYDKFTQNKKDITMNKLIIKCEMIYNIDLILYRTLKPIFGGSYGVRLIDHDKEEIIDKSGYCLDAAIEVYIKTRDKILENEQ
jgi:hypothetical protein